jgi:hypothetical protein
VQRVVSRNAPKNYRPVWRCIYCGDETRTNLTNEHIIPRGLNGNLVLPKASCKKCQCITRTFETTCLRHALLPFRYHSGLVHHLHDLPKDVPLAFRSRPASAPRRVALKDHPNYLLLPVIHGLPGIISGRPPNTAFGVTYQLYGRKDEFDALVALNEGEPLTYIEQQFDLRAFVRMLAKIAHSFAVAKLGLSGFDPDLSAFILDQIPDSGSYFVGEFAGTEPEPPVGTLHQIGWCRVPGVAIVGRCPNSSMCRTRSDPALFDNRGSPHSRLKDSMF